LAIAKVWGPDDGVPVLAVHGLMDNAGSFDTLAPLLPPHVRLVCLELCGNNVLQSQKFISYSNSISVPCMQVMDTHQPTPLE
jgi:hypothetical protein